MATPRYFKKCINGWEWGIRIALFLILLSSLVQFGLFSLTQNYMVASFGAQPEDISFALQLTYAGIITMLPVQFRFLRYFETRSYLLTNIMAGILLSILNINCTDITLFFVLRFLTGFVVANVAACILTLIFSRLKTEKMLIVGSSVFYGSILANTVIIGLLTAWVVTIWDWKVTYYYLILFQLFTLLVALLMLSPKAGFKRYPLYQIDWVGFVLFATAAVSLAYTIIYGSKYYWLADNRIRLSAGISLTAIVLFIYRQLTVKRPMINLDVFKSINFIIGLLLLAFYYGIKDSISLIYSYVTTILKWSTWDLMQLGLVNLLGLVVTLAISAQLMINKRLSTRMFLILGFGVMLAYHLWMYFLLTPDLSFTDLIIPVFLQGTSSGLLLVTLIIFIMSSTPGYTGTTGLVVAAYTRFIALLNSVAGFYNMQLYFNQYFKEGFLRNITNVSQATDERLGIYTQMFQSKGYALNQATVLANTFLGQNLAQQTQLLTNRAIFIAISLAVAIVIILIMIIPSINKTYLHWSKRMFTTSSRNLERNIPNA